MNKLYKILEVTKTINDYELTYFQDVEVDCNANGNNYFFTVKSKVLIPYEIFKKVQKFQSDDLKFNVCIEYQEKIENELINNVLTEIANEYKIKKLFFITFLHNCFI